MSDLQKRLDEAKAEVDRLEREKRQATCVELGAHDWRSYGGANAGCDDECNCSVPVYKCARCGDYDYGENAEAAEIMRACAAGDERDPVADLVARLRHDNPDLMLPPSALQIEAAAAIERLTRELAEREGYAEGSDAIAAVLETKLRAAEADLAKAQQERDIAQGNTDAAICDFNDALAELAKAREVLDRYREAVKIDVTMEGPRFMGANASALKRAWDADRAALAPAKPPLIGAGIADAAIRAYLAAAPAPTVSGEPEWAWEQFDALASALARAREALTQAEACMSIVEPRSDKAEYLRILGVIRAALAPEGK